MNTKFKSEDFNMSNHLFVIASRKKYRFTSNRGPLNVEQLWDLPLTIADGFDLNSVAREQARALSDLQQQDFVGTQNSAAVAAATDKLDIVKFVIKAKQDEAEARRTAADNRQRRDVLLAALEQKETAALQSLTPEQIRAELDKLGS